MKNLKMFAIGLAAFAAMTMGVHATDGNYGGADTAACTSAKNCVASIKGNKYSDFGKALADALSGDTITLVGNVTNGSTVTLTEGNASIQPIEKNVKIVLDGHNLALGAVEITIGNGGTITITGTTKNEVVSSTSGGGVFTVKKGGSLVVEGPITFGSATTNRLVKVDGGSLTINGGATLTAKSSTGKLIEYTAEGGSVSLNANVGTSTTAFAETFIDTTAIDENSNATLTLENGTYYISSTIATVKDGLTVTVKNGTYNNNTTSDADMFTVNGGALTIDNGTLTSKAGVVVRVTGGDVTVNAGTLKSTNNTVILAKGNADVDGSLTINGGKIAAEGIYSPIYLEHAGLKYLIKDVTVDGAKNVPAIYIKDELLTGMEEYGDEDPFKNMVISGSFKYLVVGQKTSDKKHTAEEVTAYIVADDSTVTENGNYKVVTAKAENQDPSAGEADTPETTNPDVPNVPKTSDSILVYAGLGIVSALSVGFASRRKENN